MNIGEEFLKLYLNSNSDNRVRSTVIQKLLKQDKKTLSRFKQLKELNLTDGLNRTIDSLSSSSFNTLLYNNICSGKRGQFEFESQIDKTKFFDALNQHKNPSNDDPHLGLEIELIYPNNINLKELLYHHSKYVNITSDGSITGYSSTEKTAELRICIKQSQLDTVFKCIIDKLKSCGARVNDSCGFHVHIDARKRKHKGIFDSLLKYEDILFLMQPKHRRDNRYCKPSWTGDHGRYNGINKDAYSKHNTIEVRMGTASLDFEFQKNWILLLTSIVDNVKLSKDLIKYVEKRIKDNT